MTARERWERLPLALRWIVGVVGVLVGYALAHTLVSAAVPDLGELGIRLVLLALAIVLALPAVARFRRSAGGKEQARRFRRAMRTGVVPDGADLDRWRPLARRHEQYLRGLRGLNRVAWALLTLLAASGAVYGGIVHGPVWWTFLVFAAVAALIGWTFDRTYGRLHARATRVADEVERAASADPTTDPPGTSS